MGKIDVYAKIMIENKKKAKQPMEINF